MSVTKIQFEAFQDGFMKSEARYPAFVAGWGTGKTMCLIAQGLKHSIRHKTNLGLICRKNFTDLRDSTMKDFERYTHLHINKESKEVQIPGTNSVIMFRHADELSKLQNINLGWFGIEQAEEFDTAESFDMLRGRLRRANTGRQGFIIANCAGHNWIWHRWKRLRKPEEQGKYDHYVLFEAKTADNMAHLPADFIEDVERLQLESPRKYNRYVLNSWEDYDLEGAFYASLMSDALKEGRLGLNTLGEPLSRVYTFWDLGIRVSDTTAVWFVQIIGSEIWAVDYYENYGEGMDHYANVINSKQHNYGVHYLPHDAKQRLQGRTLDTRIDILRSLLPQRVELCTPCGPIDRVETVRSILPRCRFHERCAVGVEALNHYKKKKNEVLSTEQQPVFAPEPLHDWASNGADAFGYMAFQYRFGEIDGRNLGFFTPKEMAIVEARDQERPHVLYGGLQRRRGTLSGLRKGA